MNRLLTFLLVAAVSVVSNIAVAQSRGADYKKQAQSFFADKEYTKARYYFLQAYNSFYAKKDMPDAVECGVKASALYHRENYYKEAFDLLRKVETSLSEEEIASGKQLPALHYTIGRERLQMYMKLKNAARSKELLSGLEQLAKASGNDSIANDALYAQAIYYYTFGMPQQGDAAINRLIGQYKSAKDYDGVSDCYRTLIDMAVKGNNARLASRAYDKLLVWNDSVRMLVAADELAALQKKYDDSLAVIDDKDGTISAKQYIIISLCVLAAILAGVLVLGGIVLMRYIMLTRRQKHTIEIANEHNRLKNEFIANISAQLRPTIGLLDQSQKPVVAINAFLDDISELSELENTLDRAYDVEDCNTQALCQNIMDGIRSKVKEGVTLAVDAPKVSVALAVEPLSQVLAHLLQNAAIYTPEGGRISLEMKKRGARLYQFIVTDSGSGIAEENAESIFKPFTEIRDLTEGDALGLPICSLKLAKMNGTITLDGSYKRGARFVVEIRV
ncbi:sensor histidine kinase [Muribaculum intestinale]|uniref:histidine kinase n=1 Tax=Muribaculum intestinale TaxID=1796646 RepID=A0A4S2FZZ5_9BACT|nr:ATP-binding protein [Muribaculum intestinale]MYM11649.1 sensor histidine kinase [Muribaculum intestinale]TGY75111.1 sensor histidine kinase [Muribaculum intestinale]